MRRYHIPSRLFARFERYGHRTVVSRQLSEYPLRLAVPDGPDDDPAALAYLGLVAGGIGQGDDLSLALELGPDAHALITTPSAGKILSMQGGSAVQRITCTLDKGAILEYLPDEVILFAGSRFRQELTVRLAATATLLLGDLIAPGRTGRGECFAYAAYRSRLRVLRTGRLVLHDVVDLRPADPALASPGLLGGYSHYGSFIAAAPGAGAGLADEIHAALAEIPSITGSASAGDGLVVARFLGRSTGEVRRGIRTAWCLARQRLLDRPAEGIPGKLLP